MLPDCSNMLVFNVCVFKDFNWISKLLVESFPGIVTWKYRMKYDK